MLDKIRRFWIDGVLDRSLHGQTLLELGKVVHPEHVAYPWDIVLEHPALMPSEVPPEIPIIELFDQHCGELLILGEPGAGKTTMLLDLARSLLKRADLEPRNPIPIVFNTPSWGKPALLLSDWITDELMNRYDISPKVSARWLEEEQILPLLDGLDEVAPEARASCIYAINSFRRTHSLPGLIVCCRTIDYKEQPEKLRLTTALSLRSLSEEQIDKYLNDAGAKGTDARQIVNQDPLLKELIASPLLLSIFLICFRDIELANKEGNVLGLRKKILAAYIRHMLAFRRYLHSYSAERTLMYLISMARYLFKNKLTLLQLEQIQPSWLQIKKKALQPLEKMTPANWRIIPYRLLSLPVPLLISWHLVSRLTTVSWIRWGVLSVIGICLCLGDDKIDMIRISMPGLINRLVKAAKEGLILGFFVGLGSIFIYQIYLSLRFYYVLLSDFSEKEGSTSSILWSNYKTYWGNVTHYWMLFLLILFVSPTLFSFAMAVFHIPTRSDTKDETPVSKIHWSLQSALIMSLFISILAVLSSKLIDYSCGQQMMFGCQIVSNLSISLLFLLSFISFTYFGAAAFIRHYVVRLILWSCGLLPLRAGRFLDHATDRVFLHRVGNGYKFVHRVLAEYLASLTIQEQAHILGRGGPKMTSSSPANEIPSTK